MAIFPDLSSAFSAPVTKPAPKGNGKTELDWQEIDVATLSAPLRELYESYKTAEGLATMARKEFEASMRAALPLPSPMVLRFGYRFGKLSAAIDTDGRSKARSSALSLESLSRQISNAHNQSLKIAK